MIKLQAQRRDVVVNSLVMLHSPAPKGRQHWERQAPAWHEALPDAALVLGAPGGRPTPYSFLLNKKIPLFLFPSCYIHSNLIISSHLLDGRKG